MKLNPLGNNQNEVELANDTLVLFSYKTPVAAFIPGKGFIKTNKKWSVTTSKHIKQWFDSKWSNVQAELVDQSVLDSLV